MKVGLLSLGCPKNLVDGEVMLGLVRQAGHEITQEANSADVLIVNTCAFIDRAKEESIDAILEMAELKKQGHCRRLVVTGCLAERYRDQLKAEMPEIDVVLGTGEVPAIVQAVSDTRAAGTPAVPMTFFKDGTSSVRLEPRARRTLDVPTRPAGSTVAEPAAPPRPTYLYDASTPRVLTTPSHYAYVKIAEGCNYTCAFCIIPTLRGAYRSRGEASVIEEAEALAAQGVRELLLVSQDTTFYGLDRGERGALGRLLRRLNRIGGLEWIRLLYLYPTTVTDDVLDAMAECEKVCRYVDLPLQHASDAVLRRMGRPGNRATYERLLARIRHRVPDVTLRTTFIVGFPGETTDDVDTLSSFVSAIAFDHVGVFTYSHEEATRAYGFVDDVPAAEKSRRRDRIMRTQQRIVSTGRRTQIGSIVRVLVDGASSDSPLVVTGRVEGQAPDIDSSVIFTDADPSTIVAGRFVMARIVDVAGYDLVATPLPA